MTAFNQDPRFVIEASASGKSTSWEATFARWSPFVLCLLFMPLLILVLTDRRVWSWDEAYYGEYSVWLFRTLTHSPLRWPEAMAKALVDRAPAISWLGQFFVPLEHLLSYTQTGLLCFVLFTQFLSIFFLQKTLCRIFARGSSALLACCIAAAGPLFTGLTYRYFVEPLQLLSVVWTLALAAYCQRLSRSTLILQIIAATTFGLLVKTSTPLFQLPCLLYLVFVLFKKPSHVVPHSNRLVDQALFYATLVGTILIVSGTAAWYSTNYAATVQHVREAASGSLATYYGSKGPITVKLTWWVAQFQKAFFWLPLLIALIVFSVWTILFRKKNLKFSSAEVLTILSAVWIAVVLLLFALNINEDTRYLLALLPYVAVVVCRAITAIRSSAVLLLLFGLSLTQFAVVTAQAYGVFPFEQGQLSPYLIPYVRDDKALKDSIFCAAKTFDSSPEHPTLVGVELPEFNAVGISFYSTTLGHSLEPGKWSYLGFDWTLTDADKAWQQVYRVQAHYYVFRKYNPALNADPFNHLAKAEFARLAQSPEFGFRPDKSNERVLIYQKGAVNLQKPSAPSINAYSGVSPMALLPFGLLDYPKPGTIVNSAQPLTILGWAAAPSGIARVVVTLDARRTMEAAKQNRPDVAKVYSKVKSTGYKAELDTASISDGPHRMTVTAYNREGTSRILADVNFTFHFDFPGTSRAGNRPFGLLEYPTSGISVQGRNLTIVGWTVVPSGLGSVEILLDGKHIADALLRSRPDVKSAYPGLPSSGFEFQMDLTSVPIGSHRITVISHGQSGLARVLAQASLGRQLE